MNIFFKKKKNKNKMKKI